MQGMVRAFHKLIEHPAPEEPSLQGYRLKLRADLILEEAIEFCEASGFLLEPYTHPTEGTKIRLVKVGLQQWPLMIDALCDLAYVTFGAAVEMGIELAPFFAEVHRSNLAKLDGPKRADGKKMKPEGWEPPRIAAMLSDLLRKKGTDTQ